MQEASALELFRWIRRSTTDGIWIFDDAGTTTYANDRMAEILGRTAEEMPGLAVAEALDTPGRAQFREHLEELAHAETGRDNLERVLIHKDGSRIWTLVSHSPLLDDHGVRRGWLHRVTELTDRQLLLNKVISSEQQLADAQSLAKVGSWEWDIRSDVVTWSDELFRIFALEPQDFEATYEGFLARVHPADRPIVDAAVSSAFTETEPFEFEVRIIKSSGQEGWIRGRGRLARDETGAPEHMGGTAQEITESVLAAGELAAARDAAMKASAMKSEFLTTMSHEIRTPLNGVIGLTGLLLNTQLQPTQEKLALGVSEAGRTLLGLVNDILDFSKIEAGRLELEVTEFEVRAVVDQIAALMAEPARVRSVDLVVDFHPDVPRVLLGDPVRFGQVVTNLVSNAVKFTSDGSVTVRVTSLGNDDAAATLRVEVSDTGIGIPPAAPTTLFESFTQADASTTREYGGTGLGLTISRRLVDALGGNIGFTSELGTGTTFWFTAAFQPARDRSAAEPEGARSLTRLTEVPAIEPAPVPTPGVVLVAEDNVVNQLVARGVLEGLGYVVEFANNGLEAVAAVKAGPGRFVAVLMDCQMPRLDGYEATRVIRDMEQPEVRVPIVAMTASALLGERKRCLAAGMDDFLVKPVDFGLLESTLARWVDGVVPSEDSGGSADACDVLDLGRIRMLQDLRPGEPSFFTQCLDSFFARVPADIEAIQSAAHDADHVRLVAAAHGLKGSAQNLGAAELGRLCQALEDAGERRDTAEANGLASALRHQVEQTLLALRDQPA